MRVETWNTGLPGGLLLIVVKRHPAGELVGIFMSGLEAEQNDRPQSLRPAFGVLDPSWTLKRFKIVTCRKDRFFGCNFDLDLPRRDTLVGETHRPQVYVAWDCQC